MWWNGSGFSLEEAGSGPFYPLQWEGPVRSSVCLCSNLVSTPARPWTPPLQPFSSDCSEGLWFLSRSVGIQSFCACWWTWGDPPTRHTAQVSVRALSQLQFYWETFCSRCHTAPPPTAIRTFKHSWCLFLENRNKKEVWQMHQHRYNGQRHNPVHRPVMTQILHLCVVTINRSAQGKK